MPVLSKLSLKALFRRNASMFTVIKKILASIGISLRGLSHALKRLSKHRLSHYFPVDMDYSTKVGLINLRTAAKLIRCRKNNYK